MYTIILDTSSLFIEKIFWEKFNLCAYSFSVNDDSDDSVEPRRKKTRRLWQDSDSSESDSTWGRKKKRYTYNYSNNFIINSHCQEHYVGI